MHRPRRVAAQRRDPTLAMAIGEICSREVVFIARSESCAQAARLMRENHVGSVVVVAKAGAPVMPIGMITDRDLAVGGDEADRLGAGGVEAAGDADRLAAHLGQTLVGRELDPERGQRRIVAHARRLPQLCDT